MGTPELRGTEQMLDEHHLSVTSGPSTARHAWGASSGHSFSKCGRGVQPVAPGPHAAQDGYEYGPTQIVNLLKT